MADPAFTSEVKKALDNYVVPPLPAGFSDRLMARIESGDTKLADPAPAIDLPARLRPASPWRRTGRIIGSVALLSLATATAAAAGIFGKPVYMPGISEVLVEAKIMPAPAPLTAQKPKALTTNTTAAPSETATKAPATGSAAIVDRITAMRKDPDYARLSAKERLAVAAKEVRGMIRSGDAKPEDVHAAVRELARNADPQTKAVWQQAAAERRERLRERRGLTARPANDGMAADANDAALTADELAVADTGKLSRERLEALREQYRNATPSQRAAMRRALRQKRLEQQRLRAQ